MILELFGVSSGYLAYKGGRIFKTYSDLLARRPSEAGAIEPLGAEYSAHVEVLGTKSTWTAPMYVGVGVSVPIGGGYDTNDYLLFNRLYDSVDKKGRDNMDVCLDNVTYTTSHIYDADQLNNLRAAYSIPRGAFPAVFPMQLRVAEIPRMITIWQSSRYAYIRASRAALARIVAVEHHTNPVVIRVVGAVAAISGIALLWDGFKNNAPLNR